MVTNFVISIDCLNSYIHMYACILCMANGLVVVSIEKMFILRS